MTRNWSFYLNYMLTKVHFTFLIKLLQAQLVQDHEPHVSPEILCLT